MNQPIEFDLIQRHQALAIWLAECKRKMGLMFPKIEFESDHWPVKTLYNTPQKDWYFTNTFVAFESRDVSFCDAVRGMMAELIIQGNPKNLHAPSSAFRLLRKSSAQSVFEITLNDLRTVEDCCLSEARTHPPSAAAGVRYLYLLKKQIRLLSDKGITPRVGFNVRREIEAELVKLYKFNKSKVNAKKSSTLDCRIEAFNDALNALIVNDPRLSAGDRVAIAVTTRLMCAPSRINEILCSATDDHVTVEDYVRRSSDKESDELHSAHQMLLITMKGSKGSQWGAKPALNFMIDAFNYTTAVIKQYGQRSRMLIGWYLQHPNTLYLPPVLEYLRGRDLSRKDLAKIINLTDSPHEGAHKAGAKTYFKELKDRQVKVSNRNSVLNLGQGQLRRGKMIDVLPFEDVEQLLLKKVHEAMNDCRKVTQTNHYDGDLLKMLLLFDREETPFLPGAINYHFIRNRLKKSQSDAKKPRAPTLFEKLGITMPVNGAMQIGEIETHDPRRWLTTQALRHGEKLSDVLINKWANRLKLAQLKAYDKRTDEELASFSRMPESTELTDISKGIEQASKLEEEYGFRSEIVTVHDAGISVTSMNQVLQSVEDRPIARTSEQVIILYPSRFGACLHQHHETPCRNYDSCLPCDNNIAVKGHLPTNDKVRKRSELLRKSIIRQIERLAYEHNRGIADDPLSLAQHMVALVKKGLNRDQMADYLIDEFHDVKNLIKDKLLAKRLEEAFVARGFVKRLDDNEVASGALIKYHNPTYHASPGFEKALDSHGGREQIERDEQKLIEKYPWFAPKASGLEDERCLLEADDEDVEDLR